MPFEEIYEILNRNTDYMTEEQKEGIKFVNTLIETFEKEVLDLKKMKKEHEIPNERLNQIVALVFKAPEIKKIRLAHHGDFVSIFKFKENLNIIQDPEMLKWWRKSRRYEVKAPIPVLKLAFSVKHALDDQKPLPEPLKRDKFVKLLENYFLEPDFDLYKTRIINREQIVKDNSFLNNPKLQNIKKLGTYYTFCSVCRSELEDIQDKENVTEQVHFCEKCLRVCTKSVSNCHACKTPF